MLLANFTDRTLELTRMKRIVRACVAGLCLVTVSLAITGALYETIGSRHDAQRFRRRGHLVQVGSIRMNIDCSGKGSPTDLPRPFLECMRRDFHSPAEKRK